MEGKKTITLLLRAYEKQNIVWDLNINAWNKPELSGLLRPLKRLLLRGNVKFAKETSPRLKGIVELMLVASVESLKRPEIVELIVSFCSELSNIAEVAKVSGEYTELWHELIRHEEVPYNRVYELLGVRPVVEFSSGWRDDVISQMMIYPANFSRGNVGYFSRGKIDEENASFWLSQRIRREMAKVFFGPGALLPIWCERLPEDTALKVNSFERSVASDVTYMEGLNSAISLCGTADGVSASKLKQIAKNVKSGEFADYGCRNVPSRIDLEGMAYIMLLQHNRKYRNKIETGSAPEFARYVLRNLPGELSGPLFQHLIPAYKGFRRSWTDNHRAAIIASLINTLVFVAGDQWIDMSNFIVRYLSSDNLISAHSAYTGLFPVDSKYQSTLQPTDQNQNNDAKSYSYSRYTGHQGVDWWQLQLMFIANYLRLLCAVGIIDIAADSGADDSENPLAAIRYVRPTPLGLYAFGLTETYDEAAQEDSETRYDFDDDNLIVTILTENSPFELFLNKIGRKIGGRRYRVDARTIIANSANTEDAQKNIATFRKTICRNPGKVWEEMLQEAESRTDSSQYDPDHYMLIWLKPEISGLIEYVTGDSEIMDRCIRADGCRLLVPDDYYDTFQKRLHAAGYLL